MKKKKKKNDENKIANQAYELGDSETKPPFPASPTFQESKATIKPIP